MVGGHDNGLFDYDWGYHITYYGHNIQAPNRVRVRRDFVIIYQEGTDEENNLYCYIDFSNIKRKWM